MSAVRGAGVRHANNNLHGPQHHNVTISQGERHSIDTCATTEELCVLSHSLVDIVFSSELCQVSRGGLLARASGGQNLEKLEQAAKKGEARCKVRDK